MDLSIIIPIYNERESIGKLYDNLNGALSGMNLKYEVLLIDDGSIDGTFDELLKVHRKNKLFKIIRFRKNFGQTSAISAGFSYAEGEVVVTLDADLQNDPRDIPVLLEKLNEGYDIVSGWRKNRKDKAVTRRFPSIVANKIISKLTRVNLHDYGCTLKAYRKEVVKNIDLYGEMHRYIPAIASWMGVKVAEVPVMHHSRKYGKSKYGVSRTIKVILDIITVKFLLSYSQSPIQMFGLLGLFSGIVGFIVTAYLIIMRIFFNQSLADRPLFILSIFMIFIGVQLITIGLLAEVLIRVYHKVQDRTTYVIKDIIL
ncbi:MAG: glycosyltransferase family 2 protein [Actinobacteria bacterium]|nr:glycosyltransferase family 2 protein [Actinomycetota bacterium]MBE3092185.1 glycosyltransferase family 2 protein [Chloroflexota bacterium]MBE3114705.1 glycosyltransferase family 2 protein [Actinomycetota bacterium]